MPVVTTVSDALAIAVGILKEHGPDVTCSATEYRQHEGMETFGFSLHLGDDCRIIDVNSHQEHADWDAALGKLRATHVDTVADMRREAAAKATP